MFGHISTHNTAVRVTSLSYNVPAWPIFHFSFCRKLSYLILVVGLVCCYAHATIYNMQQIAKVFSPRLDRAEKKDHY